MAKDKALKILVVDDETSLRHAIAFDITRNGYKAIEAENGAQALDIVKNQEIALVLSDVRMPVSNGVELLKGIKEFNPKGPPLIFVTGFSDVTIEEAYNMGAYAMFAKPFDRKTLIATVSEALVPTEERWKTKIREPSATDFSIDLRSSQEPDTFLRKRVNLGRGGVFVPMREPFPDVLSEIFFSMKFGTNKAETLDGLGRVRWVRKNDDGPLKAGCAVEFIALSDTCRSQILERINSLTGPAQIPKTVEA